MLTTVIEVDATLRIKNLSIALEALSRITGYAATTLHTEIQEALMQELKAFREEKEKENQWPRQGPARTTTNNIMDDDINS